VRAEGVGAIGPTGHRNRHPSADQDYFVTQIPRLDGCFSAPLQLLANASFKRERH
jgi:hypothetical protein